MKSVRFVLAAICLAPVFIPQVQAQPLAPVAQAQTLTVSIGGEVLRPGAYQVPTNAALSALLTLANVTPRAALTQATVIRNGRKLPVNLRDELRLPAGQTGFGLQDGDFVLVPVNNQRVLVLGEVKKPGIYTIPEGGTLSVADALSLAGGSLEKRSKQLWLVPAQQPASTVSPSVTKDVEPSRILQNGDAVFVPKTSTKPTAKRLSRGTRLS